MVLLQDYIQKAIVNPNIDEKCIDLHQANCNIKFLQQIFVGIKSVFKLYLIVHLAQLVLFKRKKLKEAPKNTILKFFKDLTKSLLFGGLTSGLSRRVVCLVTQFYGFSGNVSILALVAGSMAILAENASRRQQIAIYAANKGLQCIYKLLQRRNLAVKIDNWEIIMFGFAVSILGYFYKNQPVRFKPTYYSMLNRVIGQL